LGREKKENKPKKMKEYKQEFLPPVELKTNPDYPVKFPDLVVAGHKVTPREADIFYTYHTTHDSTLVCKQFGMTKQNLWDMTKRDWWQRWNLDQLKDWMDTARNRWFTNAHKLIQAQADFLDRPDDFPPGYGQAVAKMIDTFLRASPEGLRPTLVSKFEHEFQAELKETVDININITSDKIKKLSPEQIDDWNRTGVMPQVLTEVLGETVDIDFEDVEEDD
jgi:hypothetical protein